MALVLGGLLAFSSPAVPCQNPVVNRAFISSFNLVVDGTADFSKPGTIKIAVSRTVKGPRFKRLNVAIAHSPSDEVWCPPAKPWTFFGEGELYPTDKPLSGRFFLMKYENGRYLVHWFTPAKKG